MDSPKSLWSDLPLTAGIATLVCYAGVFNDVIGVEEVAARLGVPRDRGFSQALDDLVRQGKVIVQDGFAGLPGLEEQLAAKAGKIATARRLIQSRLGCLRRLGMSPIIEFVGISGSLAAGNPVRDQENHLDLDVFLITRHQYLWLCRILLGFRHLFDWREPEPELCVNYIMDAAYLMVINRNFYTATDIRNLIPVTGIDTYRRFLQANRWVDYYYPGLSGSPAPDRAPARGRLISKCFFVIYAVLRTIKWRDMGILRKLSFKEDLRGGVGLELHAPAHGGYQALVQKKFRRLAETCFPELLHAGLIERMFPDELGVAIEGGNSDLAALMAVTNIGPGYRKYA